MRKAICWVPVLLTVALGTSKAESLRVPLPGLCGYYSDGTLGITTFVMSSLPTAITAVHLEIKGELTAGVQRCPLGPVDSYLGMVFSGKMVDSTTGGEWKMGDKTLYAGAFIIRKAFGTGDGATWAFLMDGEGELELRGRWDLYETCMLILESWAIVEEVTLIVQGDFESPIESETWGRIKALFRGEW